MSKDSSEELSEASEKLIELGEKNKSPEYGATDSYSLPESHISKSLVALFLCCPYGLLAFKNALKVRRQLRSGDIEGATSSSHAALHYTFNSYRAALILYSILGIILACAVLYGFFYAISYYQE